MQRRTQMKTGELAITPDTASPAGEIQALADNDAKIVSDLAMRSKSHWWIHARANGRIPG
jgi:hypothetical protein